MDAIPDMVINALKTASLVIQLVSDTHKIPARKFSSFGYVYDSTPYWNSTKLC